MRLRASLGALAGVVWLTSAAAVPRLDEVVDSTCSTTAVEATTAVAPESSWSTASLEHATTTALTKSTCSDTSAEQATGPLTTPTHIPQVVTVTITASPPSSVFSTATALPGSLSASSPSDQPASGSSSCGSLDSAHPAFQSTGRSSGLRTVTVTKVTIGVPTAELTLPTLPAVPTLTLPTVPTLTLPTVPTLTLPTVPTLTLPTVSLPTVPTLPTVIATSAVSVVTVTVGVPTAELTLLTLTLPTLPTVPTLTLPTVPTLTLPTIPTLTLPTVSLPTVPTLPTVIATPAVSVVTVTVSEDASTLGSVDGLTAPPVHGPTLTTAVQQPSGSAYTSVLSLTYPDGPSHTVTELITITIPHSSWSPELWSTVVTPSAIPSLSTSQVLTITVHASSSSAIEAHSTCSLTSSGAYENLLESAAATTTTITVPSSSPSRASGPRSPPVSAYRPYVLTYTLSPNSAVPTPFTGTITITPSSPALTGAADHPAPLALGSTPGQLGVSSSPSSPVPSAITETFTTFIGGSTTVRTVTEFPLIVSGTPVVTVLTPHPISNSLGSSVPLIPLTITLTSAITSTSSMTIQTAPPAALQAGGHHDGPAASSGPNLVTVTVTALVAPQESAVSDAPAPSSSVQPVIVTVTVSELSSSSTEAPLPYGATTPSVTTVESNSPDQGTELGSFTILTTGVPEATGYGSLSSTSTSDDATVVGTVTASVPLVVTVTESAHESTASPSSPTSSTSSPFGGSTGSVVFATYTVPGESGVGAFTYTVTYTVPSSTTTSWGYGSDPITPSSNFWPTQTSQLTSVEASATGSSTYTLTVTPVDGPGKGEPVTITYTLGPVTLPSSSTPHATTLVSSVDPVFATSRASGYGADFSSQPHTSSTSLSHPTGAQSSASLISVTASEDADSTTTSAGNTPVVVTVTERVTAPSRSVPSSILLTNTPSDSPTAVTLSSDAALSTKSGEYQYDTTSAVLPTSVPNTPTVVTITEEPSSPTSVVVSTIVVSMVTLSHTVPIGYGSSTVIEFTTEVTVGGSSHSLATSASTVLVSSVGPTSTTSVTIPRPSNSLTSIVSATVTLSSTGPSLGANNTATMQPPDEVTIWPSPISSSSAAGPIATSHPGATTGLDSPWKTTTCTSNSQPTSVMSTSYTSKANSVPQSVGTSTDQSNGPTPSERTIWPSPTFNSSYLTFSTSYLSSTGPVPFSTTALPLFTVTTLSPALTSNAPGGAGQSSSCNESLSGPSTISISGISESETSLDLTPPPQTEFHHHAHAVTDNSISMPASTPGGYVFSEPDGGYGNPESGYGSPAQSTSAPGSTDVVSATNSDLPFSQPTSDSSPLAYGATPIITSESADSISMPTSLRSTIITTNATVVTQPGTVFTTSSAAPVPIVTSLGPPNNLTSTWISLSRSPILTTVLSSTTVSGPPISSVVSQSPLFGNSTTLASSSTQDLASSATPRPSLVNITAIADPPPSFVGSTVVTGATVTPTSLPGSNTVSVSSTAVISPIVVTYTVISTITSLTVSQTTAFFTYTPGADSTTSATLLTDSTPSSRRTRTTSLHLTSRSHTVLLTSRPLPQTTMLSSAKTVTSTPILHSITPVSIFGTSTVLTTTTSATPPFANSTAVASDGPPTTAKPNSLSPGLPVACGVEGDREVFVFEFNDIAILAVDDEAGQNNAQPQPVPSPYHHFSFSDGFRVAVPQTSKFEPSSGNHMLQHASSSSPAQIGLAELRGNTCFRFDFQRISLGCDSTDAPCIFHVTGLQWDGAEDVVQGDTTFEIAACPESSDCTLISRALDVSVAPSFTNLTAINITLASSKTPTWWADDLQIVWTEDECETAACRAQVPNTVASKPQGSVAGKAKGLLRWAVHESDPFISDFPLNIH